MKWDIDAVRSQFPALKMQVGGEPAVFFDGPGGTQVPRRVLDSLEHYLVRANANRGGPFVTSEKTEEIIEEGRLAAATLLGASPEEVAFGANMTTLNYSLSRALLRHLNPGDEIVITDLDHEANRGPWLALSEMGMEVRSVRIDPGDGSLDLEHLASTVTPRTRVAAITAASNALGTIVDTAKVRRLLPDDCILVVDGVHFTPHEPVDVRAMDCDFFLCSAYKFFGPHIGVLYGRSRFFERLETDRLRPQKDSPPDRIETGTLNHEGIAGTAAAVAFMADPMATGRSLDRQGLLDSVRAMKSYENELFETLYRGLESIPGVTIHGPGLDVPRTPTAGFTVEGKDARTVVEHLGHSGIFAWDGHFYAMTLVEKLAPGPGGLVRVGLAPYNTRGEVERLLQRVESMV